MNQPHFILNLYPLDCQSTQFEPLGNAGGMSGAQFWRITSPRGTLILRRWPQEHPTPDRLRFIHAVLNHAAQRDITFLPVPIRATTGESFITHGRHLWELAPWMPGTADYALAPSDEKLRAAMCALAQVHIALAGFESTEFGAIARMAGKSPAAAHRLTQLRETEQRGAQELAAAITPAIWPEFAPLARQFLAALPRVLPIAISQLAQIVDVTLPLQPCLRDIWHDHILFTGSEVTGIVDFGAVDIDTIACDVSRLLGGLVGEYPAGWQTGLDAYTALRPLSADELRTVTAFNCSIVPIAGCNWLRWICIERRQFENPAQVIQHFGRIVARCSQPWAGSIPT